MLTDLLQIILSYIIPWVHFMPAALVIRLKKAEAWIIVLSTKSIKSPNKVIQTNKRIIFIPSMSWLDSYHSPMWAKATIYLV